MRHVTKAILIATLCLAATDSFARGGFSGGGRGGFSGGRSFSSPSRSFSSPSRSYSSPRTTTVTRNTTIIRRGYGSYGYYGMYGHPMMFGPFGMGYGYSNGLIQGLIIGNLMHPQGTAVYSGGGYSGNALLYPDGRVVDQNGYQVGMYANNHFTPMQGGMVAQPAPAPMQTAEPDSFGWEIAGGIIVGSLVVILIIFLLA